MTDPAPITARAREIAHQHTSCLYREGGEHGPHSIFCDDLTKKLIALADEAVAAEREACAKVADAQADYRIKAAEMELPVEPSRTIAADRAAVARQIANDIRGRP